MSCGLETKLVPENGFQLALIHSAGLKSVGVKGTLKGLATLPRSFVEAWRLLREFRPNVVVGCRWLCLWSGLDDGCRNGNSDPRDGLKCIARFHQPSPCKILSTAPR